MEPSSRDDLSRRDFHRGMVAMGLAAQVGAAALPAAPEPEDFYQEPARRGLVEAAGLLVVGARLCPPRHESLPPTSRAFHLRPSTHSAECPRPSILGLTHRGQGATLQGKPGTKPWLHLATVVSWVPVGRAARAGLATPVVAVASLSLPWSAEAPPAERCGVHRSPRQPARKTRSCSRERRSPP